MCFHAKYSPRAISPIVATTKNIFAFIIAMTKFIGFSSDAIFPSNLNGIAIIENPSLPIFQKSFPIPATIDFAIFPTSSTPIPILAIAPPILKPRLPIPLAIPFMPLPSRLTPEAIPLIAPNKPLPSMPVTVPTAPNTLLTPVAAILPTLTIAPNVPAMPLVTIDVRAEIADVTKKCLFMLLFSSSNCLQMFFQIVSKFFATVESLSSCTSVFFSNVGSCYVTFSVF